MFSLIFPLIISACFASQIASPPFRCGETPSSIYSCFGNPKFPKPEVAIHCEPATSECERLTCIFTKSGWLKDGRVEKRKVAAYYDQFSANNPPWAQAMQLAKEDCLVDTLLPQGVYLNCPAYDITFCSLGKFVKNVPASQWSNTKECDYSKQFAANCPACPSGCFGRLVPYGSCNACLL